MRNDPENTSPDRQYAAAYAAHYTQRDLPMALQLYREVMASYPGTREADYAREQIQNIVNTTVSKRELLDAEIELALAHFNHDAPSDDGRTAVRPIASGLST
ncbi:MAG: hypothetical protein JW818_21195 [Pirellulales bacterium]|nr:hypothetical protein [Pirellulales bacterium]